MVLKVKTYNQFEDKEEIQRVNIDNILYYQKSDAEFNPVFNSVIKMVNGSFIYSIQSVEELDSIFEKAGKKVVG